MADVQAELENILLMALSLPKNTGGLSYQGIIIPFAYNADSESLSGGKCLTPQKVELANITKGSG